MMRLVIATMLTALSFGCTTQLNLPMKVVGKYVSSTGRCYLEIEPNRGMQNDKLSFETGYHEAYCQYEVGQEIK